MCAALETSLPYPSIKIAPQNKIFKQHHPTTKTCRPTMPFSDFVTPPPRTPFTRDFFYSLTFDALADVRLPVIAPSGNILHRIHNGDVPTGDSSESFRVDVDDLREYKFHLRRYLCSPDPDCTVTIEEAGAIFLVR